MFSAATKTGSQPSASANYIEDVFSTWLYTGTGASQTITNNIALSGKGGLTWIKSRSDATNNNLFDTTQGATKLLHSNTTDATVTDTVSLTAFNSTGFTLGTGSTSGSEVNVSAATYASWTFRKQPKFFDIVSYTGTGAVQAINHSLGSIPGMIIVKSLTNGTNGWYVYHKGMNGGVNPEQYWNQLNTTSAQHQNTSVWNDTAPTSTQFTVGTSGGPNGNGQPFIAYIFADQAGGFGATGTDSAIACGSYTGTGAAGNFVSLGWEPQYVMIKDASSAYGWYIQDVMRGMSNTGEEFLFANTAGTATNSPANYITPNATGFTVNSGASGLNASGDSYIYMAIRRPMKPPTDATTVFLPSATSATTGTTITTNFPVDLQFMKTRSSVDAWIWTDRLRGINTNSTDGSRPYLNSALTGSESNSTGMSTSYTNVGYNIGSAYSSVSMGYYNLSRRPGFFDEVCYTGTGSATTQAHNLGVVPEMMIIKSRSATGNWPVYHTGSVASGNPQTSGIYLNTTAASISAGNGFWNSTAPTSSVFSLATSGNTNPSGTTMVAYLFATCPGVSKVGSYTGNGTTQAIACGFTGGARFVLIKRTDAAGDWYVYDTARGMTTLTDPYLLLNSTAAESATLGSVTTTTGGFTVNAAILSAINTSGASYIFLAIA
jgi:hypothetical protein